MILTKIFQLRKQRPHEEPYTGIIEMCQPSGAGQSDDFTKAQTVVKICTMGDNNSIHSFELGGI